jgi:hypothetical protein
LSASLVRRLIYRFAAIGYGDTEQLYGGFAGLSAQCEQYQIKSLKPGARSIAAAQAQDAVQAS